jgi:hypothetical protein
MSDRMEAHTFVFADLAGYTAVTEAHGDELAADIAASDARRLKTSCMAWSSTHAGSSGCVTSVSRLCCTPSAWTIGAMPSIRSAT